MLRNLTSLSKAFIIVGVLGLAACSTPPVENTVPELTGRVVDNAEVFSKNEKRNLTNLLESVDRKHKAEFVVLTINSLPETESLEEFSNKTFNTWKIGRKDTDSGLLFLLVKNDRKIRIEVGRGNEGTIPDMYAKKIIEEKMAPKFKQQKFYEGFRDAVRMAEAYVGEPH